MSGTNKLTSLSIDHLLSIMLDWWVVDVVVRSEALKSFNVKNFEYLLSSYNILYRTTAMFLLSSLQSACVAAILSQISGNDFKGVDHVYCRLAGG